MVCQKPNQLIPLMSRTQINEIRIRSYLVKPICEIPLSIEAIMFLYFLPQSLRLYLQRGRKGYLNKKVNFLVVDNKGETDDYF